MSSCRTHRHSQHPTTGQSPLWIGASVAWLLLLLGPLSARAEDSSEPYFQPKAEQGQAAQFTGDAAWSLPIDLPEGAGGMTLPLALTYSSAVSSSKSTAGDTDGGWVGLGFSLDVGRIERSSSAEGLHRLVVAGTSSELKLAEKIETGASCNVSGSSDWLCRDENLWRYNTEEAKFWRIEKTFRTWDRAGQVLSDDARFVVHTTGGTRYDFGSRFFEQVPEQSLTSTYGGLCTPDASTQCPNRSYLARSTSTGVEELRFHGWGLERITDPQGNMVEIQYKPFEWAGGGDQETRGWKEMYPVRVLYTTNPGAGDHHAEWEVEFEVSPKAIDTLVAHQVAQSGVLLENIRIYYRPVAGARQMVGRYRFSYDADPADGTHLLKQLRRFGLEYADQEPGTFFTYADRLITGNQTRSFLESVRHRGAETRFVYEDLVNGNLRRPRVRDRETDPGPGEPVVRRFDYGPATLHLENGVPTELIGYDRITQTVVGDPLDRREITDYSVSGDRDDPLNGKVLSFEITEGTQPRSRSESLWQAEPRYRVGTSTLAGHFVYRRRTVETTWDDDLVPHTRRKVYFYQPNYQGGAQYGNLTRIDEFDSLGASTPWRSTQRSYSANTEHWIVDRLNVEHIYPGVPWVGEYLSRRSWIWRPGKIQNHGPDTTTLLYGERVYFFDETGVERSVDTRHTYDAFGNRTSTSTFGAYGTTSDWASDDPRVESTTYEDDHHTYAISRRNALDHETQFHYYRVNALAGGLGYGPPGQLQAVRDPNGRLTSYQYDGLGRRIAAWRPSIQAIRWDLDEATERWTFLDSHETGTADGVRHQRRDDDGTAPHFLDRWTFFDGLGRAIQEQVRWDSATKILSHTHYHPWGQRQRRSHPITVVWPDDEFAEDEWQRTDLGATSWEYDVLGRVTRHIHPSGNARTFDYLGQPGSVAVTNEEGTGRISQEHDARGNSIRTLEEDFVGNTSATTDRAFTSRGELQQITDAEGNIVRFGYDGLGRLLWEDDPDRGLTQYRYDAFGNQIQLQNATGQRLCTWFDALDRPTETLQLDSNCPATPPAGAARLVYDLGPDGKGRLSGTETDQRSEELAYDRRGRLVRQDVWITGAPSVYTTEWAYDEADRVTAMTYPDGVQLRQLYQSNLDLLYRSWLVNPDGSQGGDLVTHTGYTAWLQPKIQILGNGLETRRDYHGRGWDYRLKQLRTGTNSAPGLHQNFEYTDYDANGNVLQWIDSRGPVAGGIEVQNFAYDGLGRLVQASTVPSPSSADYDFTYHYDEIGNLESVDWWRDGEGSGTTTYGYGFGSAGPHAKTHVDAAGSMTASNQVMAYDAAGRISSRKVGATTWLYSWDASDRLVEVQEAAPLTPTRTTQLARGIDGELTKKSGPDGTAYLVGPHYEVRVLTPSCEDPCDQQFVTDKSSSTEATRVYFFGGRRLAEDRVVGSFTQRRFLHPDHLGTTSMVSDAGGNVLHEARMFPYGGERWSTGSPQTDHAFAGERRHDDLDGTYEMGVRFYDPHYRTWISADTLIPDVERPQSLNRYGYVEGNPLRFVDPTGHDREDSMPWEFGDESGGDAGTVLQDSEETAALVLEAANESDYWAAPLVANYAEAVIQRREIDWESVGEHYEFYMETSSAMWLRSAYDDLTLIWTEIRPDAHRRMREFWFGSGFDPDLAEVAFTFHWIGTDVYATAPISAGILFGGVTSFLGSVVGRAGGVSMVTGTVVAHGLAPDRAANALLWARSMHPEGR